MIEDSLPEECYLKTMKDGHINIMMNKRHLFLRLETHTEGIKMSSYQHTVKNESYLGVEGWNTYVSRIERLGIDWSMKTKGKGSQSRLKPRSIDLTDQTCNKVTEEISKFLPQKTITSVPVWKRSWTAVP